MSANNNPERGYHLTMTKADMEQLSYALADVLCWHNGFRAAKGDDAPFVNGLDVLREHNIFLRSRLADIDRHEHQPIGQRAGYAE